MGLISFGSWDLTTYAVTYFSYLPVDSSNGQWVVPVTNFTIGKTTVDNLSTAVFDPNTHYIGILAYTEFRTAICNLVKCGSYFSEVRFDCSNSKDSCLPDLVFQLNGHNFSISPKFYIRHWYGDECQAFVKESSMCVLGIPFMQAYYTLFDAENSRIGLARSVNYPYEQITTMTSEAEGSSLVLIGGILGGLAVAGYLL